MTFELLWGSSTYTPEKVLAAGTTFGGESGKSNPYGGGASQTAFDMAAYLNGKYATKRDRFDGQNI